ncbi:acyltransferase family protein [Neisseria sp. Ec49-e6-T10]|uniref:acyltransferase family protein n=1 Tax=Neisseria sp. Ec49-e6-T10 TaxID=3140744 RepID=UPI003EBE6DFD
MDKTQNKRLLALDVFRGMTIVGMILVNNPGSLKYIYPLLKHAQLNGLTFADLVFPFFMFIMGVSIFISLNKSNFTCDVTTLIKVAKRTFTLFLIGLILGWLSLALRNFSQLSNENLNLGIRFLSATTNLEHLRILAVLQRLAISYGIVCLMVLFIKHKYIPHIIILTLMGYFLLLYFGHGFELSERNIIAIVDQAVLGANHMYQDHNISFDPEGILSTISATCQVLIGFYCGKL